MGEPGAACSFNTPALDGHEALMYRSLPPESFYLSEQISLFREGENILAVEVHNVSSTSSDMSDIPFLLLGFNQTQEQYLPGNPYFSVKNEYPHTNFKIASEGEAIYLSDGTGLIVDAIDSTAIPVDYSYGRSMSDSRTFAYFELPTPGFVNDSSGSAGLVTDSVELILSGEENDSTMVQLFSPDEKDSIY